MSAAARLREMRRDLGFASSTKTYSRSLIDLTLGNRA